MVLTNSNSREEYQYSKLDKRACSDPAMFFKKNLEDYDTDDDTVKEEEKFIEETDI